MERKFSGIAFDIDNTITPDGAVTVESVEVVNSFHALPGSVFAVAATARTIEFTLPITRQLDLKHDSIVANGGQAIDSQSGVILWEQGLSAPQMRSILGVCLDVDYQFCIAGDSLDKKISALEQEPRPSVGAFILNLPKDAALEIAQKIISLDDVYVHVSESWGEVGEPVYDVNIYHALAQKDKALKRLFLENGIDSKDMVGIGDSMNDVGIFNAVGYRVAIGNAHQDLIAIADSVR